VEIGVFSGMDGLTLEAMKCMVRVGRHVGKLELCLYRERWVLLFLPPGKQGGKTFYLMGEKSRRPRLFAKADTALRIARTMVTPGLWVSFSSIPGVRYEPATRDSPTPIR
jgi:hypothetical protein